MSSDFHRGNTHHYSNFEHPEPRLIHAFTRSIDGRQDCMYQQADFEFNSTPKVASTSRIRKKVTICKHVFSCYEGTWDTLPDEGVDSNPNSKDESTLDFSSIPVLLEVYGACMTYS